MHITYLIIRAYAPVALRSDILLNSAAASAPVVIPAIPRSAELRSEKPPAWHQQQIMEVPRKLPMERPPKS